LDQSVNQLIHLETRRGGDRMLSFNLNPGIRSPPLAVSAAINIQQKSLYTALVLVIMCAALHII